jgi:cytochrome c553
MLRKRYFNLGIRWRGRVALTVALGFSAIAAADDAANSAATALTFEQKLASCAACHGPSGNAPTAPIYPRLAGQHASYLGHALRSYRAGRRKDPIMQQQVQALELSESDIVKLAVHFSKQPGLHQIAGQ